MSLMVQANGGLEIRSDVKMGEGENCIRGKSLSKNRNIVRRDGKPQLLEVLVTFDGQGGFETTVWVDKKFEIRTNYVSPDVPGAFLSEKFFFKHGVYSLNMFVYVMISRGMKVREVRISN